jgi:hypothetical protein
MPGDDGDEMDPAKWFQNLTAREKEVRIRESVIHPIQYLIQHCSNVRDLIADFLRRRRGFGCSGLSFVVILVLLL